MRSIYNQQANGNTTTTLISNTTDLFATINKQSAMFLGKLTTQIQELVDRVEQRILDATKNSTGQRANGFLFASVDTPQMVISVGAEYILYVQRNGPPPNGKFDPTILNALRVELGIPV